MRILHLSDLHATGDADEDRARLVAAMLSDVKAIASEVAVDLVIFTGDLTMTGKANEFRAAADLLLTPLESLLGITRSNIVILPGNHDIDRDRILKFAESGYRQSLDSEESVSQLLSTPEEFAAATSRLEAWNEFHMEYYKDAVNVERLSPLGAIHSLSVDGKRIKIAALNSSWRSSGPDDQRNLIVGARQVRSAIASIEDADIRIVAFHHPLDWLTSFDHDTVRQALEAASCVVMTGHEHRADPTSEFSVRGRAIYARAGCLYEHATFPNTFEVVDVGMSESVEFMIRRWWPERQEYGSAEDLAKDGKLVVPFPSTDIQVRLEEVGFSAVAAVLGDHVQDLSVLSSGSGAPGLVSDLLVSPRLLPRPLREIVAAASSSEDVTPEELDTPSALDILDGAGTTVLSGEPESGLSSALFWLLNAHFESRGSHVPIYVRFDGRTDRGRIDRAIRYELGKMGLSGSGPGAPPLLLAVDDVTARYPKALARLIQFINEHPDHIFVLGTHDNDTRGFVKFFGSSDENVQRIFVGPFRRRELRLLAEQTYGPEAGPLVDRVVSLLKAEGLPRNPFIMSALMTVLQSEGSLVSVNESAIIDEWMRILLGGDSIVDVEGLSMDYRRREHLLSAFAAELTARHARHLGRLDAEEVVAAYFRKRGLVEASPGRVIDSLVARRVLMEDIDGIGFRHLALAQFFSAKWLLEGEDPAFEVNIMSSCLEHSGVLRHAAGLSRNSRKLLEQVAGRVNELMASLTGVLSVESFDSFTDTIGWSRGPDLEGFRKMLAHQVVSDVEVLDRRLDALDDSLEGDRLSEVARRDAGDLDSVLAGAVLLSSVLKNSELVDDVDLKAARLKDALHGWALVLVGLVVREDVTQEVREAIGDLLFGKDVDPKSSAAIEEIVSLALSFGLTLSIESSLGTVHLADMARRVVDDEDFMSTTAHALLATSLYCGLGLSGWPERLGRLYASHGKHAFVSHYVRMWSLFVYRTKSYPTSEERQLEDLIIDLYLPSTPGRGAGAVLNRGNAKGRLLAELRASKDRASRALGDTLDFLDDDEDEDEGRG